MKKKLFSTILLLLSNLFLFAQGVTRLNNNNSLTVHMPLSNGKTILSSAIDSSIWSTDATAGNTIQISPDIKYDGHSLAGLLPGKLFFKGSNRAGGSELYVTDGTPGGTVLVSDINPGSGSSSPQNFTILNNFLYFTAEDGIHGRELWRTNGTTAGTTIVKDIQPGAAGSFDVNTISSLFSNGAYLLFAAYNTGSGIELWKSDGTAAGTNLLKEINTANANADSSIPREFYGFNGMTLFLAKDATHGEELWKTDGSNGGTVLVKDINVGTASSTSFNFFTISLPIFKGFHEFNNHVYFNAYDGSSTGEIWVTDGNPANTTLLKDVVHGSSVSIVSVLLAENLAGKFIFPVSDGSTRSELWESDGTPAGTLLFKAFPVVNGHKIPFIFNTTTIDFINQTSTQPLFQGNKFFFLAASSTAGDELWISDGTLAGTAMVKDINPGTADGIDPSKSVSFIYTLNEFYFAATDGLYGDELWKTNGTDLGTSMVADINLNAGDAIPDIPIYLCNNKIIFSATDGDNVNATDLFVVNGNFQPIPVTLTSFSLVVKGNDALLQWSTQQEINSNCFFVQRSDNGKYFEDIATVRAAGNTNNVRRYFYTDYDILNCGKPVVYYRLKFVDNDGKFTLSQIIPLKTKGNASLDLLLFSNPAGNNNINLVVKNASGKLLVSIRDMEGRLVYSKIFDNVTGTISLPVQLEGGVYFLKADNNGESKIIKLIK